MAYNQAVMSDFQPVSEVADQLKQRIASLDNPRDVLKAPELKTLLGAIKDQPPQQRAAFGQAVNRLKRELAEQIEQRLDDEQEPAPIDVTAPYGVDVPRDQQPHLLGPEAGAIHPISVELERINDIFLRMGFSVTESPLLDDDYHMFASLNFPPDHPARDDYDTFVTEEGLILPAHTSTMQNRVLKDNKPPIAVVIPGRVFRNEDLDATHEHTFHQVEGVFVDRGVSLAHMLGTLRAFLEAYFEEAIEYKTQPFFFPFVEPGLEYLIKKPAALKKVGETAESWLEIMGCGMIHPNVLREGGLDPKIYSGFAWGMGVERLVMLKYGIEDVRHFMSGRLEFLHKFRGRL